MCFALLCAIKVGGFHPQIVFNVYRLIEFDTGYPFFKDVVTLCRVFQRFIPFHVSLRYRSKLFRRLFLEFDFLADLLHCDFFVREAFKVSPSLLNLTLVELISYKST